jgi:hypothetical protein
MNFFLFLGHFCPPGSGSNPKSTLGSMEGNIFIDPYGTGNILLGSDFRNYRTYGLQFRFYELCSI